MSSVLLPLLLPAAWALIVAAGARAGRPLREAAVLAAVACGVFLVASTEALSALSGVTRTGVAAAWGGFAAVLAAAAWRGRGRGRFPAAGRGGGARPPGRLLLALLALGALLALVGAIALAAPPNTWDSMTYHMARVAHWAQNASVAHYPTNIQRQLFMPPAAEWWILQLQVLAGGDRLANLVQWTALAGSVVGASWIAGLLGAGRWGQALAAVAAGTVPMAVMQASGTKNDLACGFWLVCAVGLGLRLLGLPREQCAPEAPAAAAGAGSAGWLTTAVAAAAAFGLAMLTKATAYLFAPPLVAAGAWALAGAARRRSDGAPPVPVRRVAAILAVFALVPAALNAGHFLRNFALTGSPFGSAVEPGPEGPTRYANDAATPAALVSNALRNAALQLGAPDPAHLTGWPGLDAVLVRPFAGLGLVGDPERRNERVERVVRRLHRALGLDPDDPARTWPGSTFRVTWQEWNHEDYVASPLHVLLLALCLVLLPWQRRPARWQALGLLAAIVAGFLLFSLVLRWQIWNNRLVLPLLLLAAPLAGLTLERACGRRGAGAAAALLLVAAVPAAVNNANRPVFGEVVPAPGERPVRAREGAAFGARSVLRAPRELQYFANRPDLHPSYAAVADAASGLDEVGLITDNDGWEYGLWALLALRGAPPRIEHVVVSLNPSGELWERPRFAGFAPTHVVVLRRSGGARIFPMLNPLPTLPPRGVR